MDQPFTRPGIMATIGTAVNFWVLAFLMYDVVTTIGESRLWCVLGIAVSNTGNSQSVCACDA